MRSPDRGFGPLPARGARPDDHHPTPSPRATLETPRGPASAGPPEARRGSPVRLVARALRRRWRLALPLWLAGSAAILVLARQGLGPAFVASSTIAIGPGESRAAPDALARRATDPEVIARAIAGRPEVLRIDRLAGGGDPAAALRRSVVASAEPGRVRLSAAADSPLEAVAIVEAVAEASLQAAREAENLEAEAGRRSSREALEGRLAEVARTREAVARQVERVGSADPQRARDRDSKAAEAYGLLTGELLRADLDLIGAKAALDRLRGEPTATASPPADVDAGVVAAFYADPRVAGLQSRLDRALEAAPEAVPKGEVEGLRARINGLWVEMKPALVAAARRTADRPAEIRSAEARALDLESRMAQIGRRLEAFQARARSAGLEELALEFARQDLARAESALDAAARAEPGPRSPAARARLEGPARASRAPGAELRAGLVAGGPAAVFLAVLGLITLAELGSGRVSDPEDVPGRLRMEVLGVVPPLPRPRAGSREGRRARLEVGRFAQGLDHIRVAISGGRDARGGPIRSVVLTSARKGEGKTALAAQLAERSSLAGLLTLLVDADLRNPALSRTLEMASRRGLAEVLAGESAAEEVIALVNGPGGFHFLPAGMPRVDPGRLLEDPRLGRLLARARESFDLVIVDAPPALPVPDALALGRWVDAAVLVARFDRSRYALLGRAARKLAAIGVPVLGAVVVGVPGGDGTYDPAYASTAPGDDPAGSVA